MNKKLWIGVDLGKADFHVAIAAPEDDPGDWARLPHAEFANTAAGIKALLAWLKKQAVQAEDVEGLCVEATGRLSWTFVELLDGRLGPVSIVNPARPVAYGRSLGVRQKTDRSDACVIALYGINRRPKPRALPSPTQRALRELMNTSDVFQKTLKAHENRLQEPIASPTVDKLLKKQVRILKKEMAALEKEMDRLIAQDPQRSSDAQRLKSIPGVGNKTVHVLMAHYGDLRGYRRNELVALAGLYPRHYESGTSVWRKPKLVKGGGARVRAALYMAALSAKRFCPHMRRHAEQLSKRGLHNMVILGIIMRKLLVLMRALVISEKDYQGDYPNVLCSAAN